MWRCRGKLQICPKPQKTVLAGKIPGKDEKTALYVLPPYQLYAGDCTFKYILSPSALDCHRYDCLVQAYQLPACPKLLTPCEPPNILEIHLLEISSMSAKLPSAMSSPAVSTSGRYLVAIALPFASLVCGLWIVGSRDCLHWANEVSDWIIGDNGPNHNEVALHTLRLVARTLVGVLGCYKLLRIKLLVRWLLPARKYVGGEVAHTRPLACYTRTQGHDTGFTLLVYPKFLLRRSVAPNMSGA